MNDIPIGASLNACDEVLGAALKARLADQPALLWNNQTITFQELDRLTCRFASALERGGLVRGDRVMLLLKDSPDFVACWLGTIKAGAIAVAVNTRSAAKDLAFMVEDSGCRLLVIDEDFWPLWEEVLCSCQGSLPQVVVRRGIHHGSAVSLEAFTEGAAEKFDSASTSAGDMAFWLYTSGTTGAPKAAIHCHRDVIIGDCHLRQNLGVRPGDRLFSSSKLFFAFALGHCLIGGLRAGATLILYEGWPDSPSVAAVVDRYRPSVMFSVPTFYRNLLREGMASQAGFKDVRHYVSAGENLPASLYQRWMDATGVPVVEGIGATETIFLGIAGTPSHHKPGATGKPVPWAEARLLDLDDMPVTTPHTPGVLWLKMASVCCGYWKQPEKSAESFRDGWYRTGDVFTVDEEGWWFHHGRSDDLLKISGQWVSPAEIEACTLTVPGVTEAAVVGVPNAEGLVRLALFVVSESGQSPQLEAAVRETLRSTLSIYKCPRTIVFVDDVPRTATGKVQRFRLRQMAAEVVPSQGDRQVVQSPTSLSR